METDPAGRVPGGRKVPVGLGARHLPGAPDTGRLRGGSLEVSYDDGGTGRPVALTGERASWRGTLTVPRGARSVSSRASARDATGGSVTQQLVGAVGVR